MSMLQLARESGIPAIDDLPWGSHLCQFYRHKQDLLEVVASYLARGLANNERCMWVIANPVIVEDCLGALRQVVPDVERRLQIGQLGILHHDGWYLEGGRFDMVRVLEGWHAEL